MVATGALLVSCGSTEHRESIGHLSCPDTIARISVAPAEDRERFVLDVEFTSAPEDRSAVSSASVVCSRAPGTLELIAPDGIELRAEVLETEPDRSTVEVSLKSTGGPAPSKLQLTIPRS